MITRPDSWPGAGPIAQEGWHNIVLSPEDAYGPAMGTSSCHPSADPLEIGPQAAAAVCGLTGLWSGIDEAPLDRREPLPAESVRVARTFFRHLDADAVDTQLRDGVLSMAGGLPIPRVGNSRAVEVRDVPLATSTMAEDLWAKHHRVLRGDRAEMPETEIKKIGGWTLVKHFFSFLWAAIKGAVAGWAPALARRVGGSVASALQRGLLGGTNESAYRVVVWGTLPDGSPAGWDEIGQAAGRLSEVVGDPAGRGIQAADSDLRQVWHDYVRATLTLADAGDRSAQLPPVQVGVTRGVLSRTNDCAPRPGSDFGPFPDNLRVVGQSTSRLPMCSRSRSHERTWVGRGWTPPSVRTATVLSGRSTSGRQGIRTASPSVRRPGSAWPSCSCGTRYASC